MNFFSGHQNHTNSKKQYNFHSNEKELLRISELKNELNSLKNLFREEVLKKKYFEETLKNERKKYTKEINESLNLRKITKDLSEENEKIKIRLESTLFENSVLKTQLEELLEKKNMLFKNEEIQNDNIPLMLLNKIQNLEMKKDYSEGKKVVLELEVIK